MQQRMWWSGVIVGLLVLVIGMVSSGTPPVAARQPAQSAGAFTPTPVVCNPDWSIVTSPNPSSADSVLNGMTAISASDVWAVGWYDIGGNTPRTMTQHWDGTAWNIVSSPSPGGAEDVLEAVDAGSANDVWAVGSTSGNSLNPLAMHWDGSAWSIVPVPRIGIYANELRGVAVVAANDVWAVGDYYAGINPTDRLPLLEHWDGIAWSIVPGPAIPATYLWGATAISANDVWAVGFTATEALALHWDGGSWTQVPVPQSPGGQGDYVLYGVSGTAANDVWAVGVGGDLNVQAVGLTMHWDGTAWSVVPSPNPQPDTYLYAVAAVGPGDAWAVGYGVNNTVNTTLMLHWDGAAWRVVPSPNPPVGSPFLAAAAAVSGSDVWAAGAYFGVNTSRQTLIEHYINPCPSPTPSATSTPGATSTPTSTPNPLTPSATPTRPTVRNDAHLCLSLREDPDTAVQPGGLVTFTLTLVNQGPGEADTSSVQLPLDPNLEVLDAHTSNPRIYVDYVGDDAVAVRFQDLGIGSGGTVQIIARVRSGALPGTAITSRAAAVWTDRNHQRRQSNSVTLRVGPLEDRGWHGLQQVLVVEPDAPVVAGTLLTLHGDFFAEDEPVSAWLNYPDATVQSVTERARSEGSGLVRLSLDTTDLAAGTYTLVAHGWCSGVEGVGTFTVK